MSDPSKTGVERTRHGRILVATFSNPPANHLNIGLFEGISAALDELAGDDTDLLMFTGHGQVFSKGFDRQLMESCRDPAVLRGNLKLTNDIFTRVSRSPKPVVAAINGPCLGGGLEWALSCHFRVCVEKARLGLPEIWIGLVPGLGGVQRLASVVGRTKALELIALGDLISSEEALRIGLVNRVFTRAGFLDQALSFAKALASADQVAIREILRLIAAAGVKDEQDAVADAMESFVKVAPWMKPSP